MSNKIKQAERDIALARAVGLPSGTHDLRAVQAAVEAARRTQEAGR